MKAQEQDIQAYWRQGLMEMASTAADEKRKLEEKAKKEKERTK